jgi:FAD/FMN-containing dehydrogenase
MKRRAFLHSTVAVAAAATLPRTPVIRWYRVDAQDPTDLIAVRGDGGKVTIKGAALKELRAGLRGRLLLAQSEGYEQARQVLNPSIDKHPALIVQASGVADVRSAVDFARAQSLLVAVKCGGHSFSGQSTCDGGMMIDLSGFRGVRVDPAAKKAWVAGGTLLGAIDHEAMSHGLVTPLGTVSHTGVGGLTTGGGFGRVARRFGLALDNVMAVDVVTADGAFRHASQGENADLYWGVRGGGGNFGVVTSFEFQLHPMQRQVLGGSLVFPIARARELLAFYAEYSVAAPDDLYLDFFISRPPGGADGMTGFSACYSGPTSEADRVLEPLRKLGKPLVDDVKSIDYSALQRSTDTSDPRAFGSYLKNGFITEITPKLITAIVEGLEAHPGRSTDCYFQHSGGAIGRVAAGATAFAHRDSSHNLMASTAWPAGTDSAPHIGWARRFWATLEPFTQGVYVNHEGDVDAAGVAVNATYRENYARLVAVKTKYDAGNLFRLNANVTPKA